MSATYLDHAASSPMREEALTVYVETAAQIGNPSALHRLGQQARARLDSAREELAEAVGAHPTEVIFTGSGSEANAIAVLGGWASGQSVGRNRCLLSAIEHPSVAEAVGRGAEVLPVTADGLLDFAYAAQVMDPQVAVVSVMRVNNETGTIQPLDELAELAAAVGAQLHTDAVQAFGHVKVDFSSCGAHLMSLSGHKIGGPSGIGALLARRDASMAPIGLGVGQERGVRSGTVPVALAAAFARAARLAVAELETESARLQALAERIAQIVLAVGGRLNSAPGGAPHIVNATFPGIRADDLLVILDQRGVYASVGSACKAGVHQPSAVLLAMGRSVEEASQSLRFSLGRSTTEADLDRLAVVLPEATRVALGA